MLSPEARLLLAAGVDEGPAELQALLAGPIVWDRVLLLAHREKAATLLVRRLAALPGAPTPADALAQLRKLAMVIEFKMVQLKQRLDETVDVLAGAGIEPVLLKGAALWYTSYGSLADRPMADIDLLVEARQAGQARDVVLRSGWVWNEQARSDADYAAHHHLPPMDDARGTGAKLELHTELFIEGNPFHLSGDVVRRDAEAVVAGGRRLRVPSTLHQLLHTCLHFAWSHNMRMGSWRVFRDVAALTRPGFDWNAFVATAVENRAETCCYWTLRLARDLMGVEVPGSALAALRPPLPEFVLTRLERHFVTQLFPTEPECPSLAVEKLMWELGVMPRWSGHGSVRPWDEADSRLEKRRPAAASTGASKAVRQFRNLERWSRYVRAVLAPTAAPSARRHDGATAEAPRPAARAGPRGAAPDATRTAGQDAERGLAGRGSERGDGVARRAPVQQAARRH
jgi:hypothetical protein